MSIFYYLILVGSIVSISFADVFIKKAGMSAHSFGGLLSNPWFLIAILLYLIQIIGFGYLFFSGAKLTMVGITELVLYAVIIIGSGILLFHESITITQAIGMVLAITGLILINL